jgi:hypothetical protein
MSERSPPSDETPKKCPAPRPRQYTEELGKQICDALARGEPVKAICKQPGMPKEEIVRQWAFDPEHVFSAQYILVRQLGYHKISARNQRRHQPRLSSRPHRGWQKGRRRESHLSIEADGRHKENIDPTYFNGASASNKTSNDGANLAFPNLRAEAWWRFRVAIRPEQPGGSPILLPDDPQVRADLAAQRWELTARGILIESKEDIKSRRGPRRADGTEAQADGPSAPGGTQAAARRRKRADHRQVVRRASRDSAGGAVMSKTVQVKIQTMRVRRSW